MTSVDQAIKEIDDKLAELRPELEGLHDFDRLNLVEKTRSEIQISIQDYTRRVSLLETAKAALESLVTDGHPDIAVREIDPASLQDLQTNASTIEAALAKFSSNAAAKLELTGNPPQPK